MPTLTAAQIDAADDMSLLKVPVPQWGGDVYIRVMRVEDRDAHELEMLAMQNAGKAGVPDNFRSRLLARCLCDERGELLFAGEEGVKRLGKKSVAVVHELWRKAMEHNALTQDELEKLAGESTPDQP